MDFVDSSAIPSGGVSVGQSALTMLFIAFRARSCTLENSFNKFPLNVLASSSGRPVRRPGWGHQMSFIVRRHPFLHMDARHDITYQTCHLSTVGSPQGLVPIGILNSQFLQSATAFPPRVYSFPRDFVSVLDNQLLPATWHTFGIPWSHPGPCEVAQCGLRCYKKQLVLDKLPQTIIEYMTFVTHHGPPW